MHPACPHTVVTSLWLGHAQASARTHIGRKAMPFHGLDVAAVAPWPRHAAWGDALTVASRSRCALATPKRTRR